MKKIISIFFILLIFIFVIKISANSQDLHSADLPDFQYDGYINQLNKAGFNVYIDNKKTIHINGNGIKIEGKEENTFWTALTVFYNEEYNFYPDKNYVMFDIGFNLGMTSLWFARNEKITKIYAFEPFLPTCKLGERNLAINPKLSKKIKLYKIGLSDKNEQIVRHYNPKLSGSMSSASDRFKTGNLEKITLKSAGEVLKPLFDKHPNEGIFLKIDCEGAERYILPDLDRKGLLKRVDVIIMEYHDGPPDELIKILADNNFNIYCNQSDYKHQGMIVAFKK